MYVVAFAAALVVVRRDALVPLIGGVWAAVSAACSYGLLTRLLPERLGVFNPVSGYRLSEPLGYWNGLGVFAAIGFVLALTLAARATAPTIRATAAASLPVLGLDDLLHVQSRRLDCARRRAPRRDCARSAPSPARVDAPRAWARRARHSGVRVHVDRLESCRRVTRRDLRCRAPGHCCRRCGDARERAHRGRVLQAREPNHPDGKRSPRIHGGARRLGAYRARAGVRAVREPADTRVARLQGLRRAAAQSRNAAQRPAIQPLRKRPTAAVAGGVARVRARARAGLGSRHLRTVVERASAVCSEVARRP